MKQIPVDDIHLSAFVDSLQSRGQYTFRKSDALKRLSVSEGALKFAAIRLSKKKRIVSPRRGFYVIVPIEYQLSGAPPASWFIDDLMKFEEKPYYVGLLTAAALIGAGHQQPQEFQVITDSPLRPIVIGRERIRFFTKRVADKTPVDKLKTQTGQMLLSSPEATVLDLVRYQSSAGYLSNVATVILELSEKIRPRLLVEALSSENEMATIQRLGFLLDLVRQKKLSEAVHKWLSSKHPSFTNLVPSRTVPRGCQRNQKWQIVVNEQVEVDR